MVQPIKPSKVVSFLQYTLGLSEKPGPFAVLEVGSHSLRLLEAMTEGTERKILGIWEKEIPWQEEMTPAEREKELREGVKNFLKSAPLTTKKIYLGLAGDFLCVRRLVVPEMPKEELPKALRWAARTQLPFPVDGAALEHEIVDVKDKKEEVAVVAAREETLARWAFTVQEAGFRIGSITSSHLSLLAWIRESGLVVGQEPTALLDIGGTHTTLFIMGEGKVRFVRDLEIGGDSITRALTQGLATFEGELRLDFQEAEQLKKNYGFPLQGQVPNEKLSASQIVSLMRPILEKLANEIKLSFEYFNKEFGKGPQKAYLFGGSSRLKNLTAFLSEKIGHPVELLPLLPGFRGGAMEAEERTDRFPSLATSLGVAFQEGRGPNLLPSRFRERKTQILSRIALRVTSIVTVLALCTMLSYEGMRHHLLRKELSFSGSSWKMFQEIESLKKELEVRKEVLAQLKERHPYLIGALKEVSNTLPSHAVIDRISFPQATDELRLSGMIFTVANQSTETLVTELISHFEKSPFFKEVKLISTQRDASYEQPASHFEIMCRLRMRR